MKKTFLFILATGFAISGVLAQSSETPANSAPATIRRAPMGTAERAKQATDKIATQANLSADQRTKVYDVLSDYYNKVEPIKKADTGKNSPEAKAKIDGLKNDVFAKLQGILSADQINTVKAMFGTQQTTK